MNELTLFNSLFNGEVGSLLNMPVYTRKEDGEAYTMEMDLPGRSEKDVDIELDNNTLTISSKQEEKNEMEETEKEENGRWLIRERRVSSFKRSFTLPEDVNLEALNASFKNGILTVKLPRRALSQPKKIAIKSE